jgi:hypothetical protein
MYVSLKGNTPRPRSNDLGYKKFLSPRHGESVRRGRGEQREKRHSHDES